jgi:hypothetical protein
MRKFGAKWAGGRASPKYHISGDANQAPLADGTHSSPFPPNTTTSPPSPAGRSRQIPAKTRATDRHAAPPPPPLPVQCRGTAQSSGTGNPTHVSPTTGPSSPTPETAPSILSASSAAARRQLPSVSAASSLPLPSRSPPASPTPPRPILSGTISSTRSTRGTCLLHQQVYPTVVALAGHSASPVCASAISPRRRRRRVRQHHSRAPRQRAAPPACTPTAAA